MNKKEVTEIKKQFTPENCSITRICGCYVDAEKEKKLTLKEAFLSLPEEEAFKYFEIFKKTLSGTLGKNLLNLEFPLESEFNGKSQEFLLSLRDSRLQDDALLEEFYDKIIESYYYGENYFIILIHAAYDVPGKAKDGQEMFDASDEVYEYLLCSICPVKLSKAGLCYNAERNSIEDRARDWLVELPAKGFLFPAFNDRSSDIHHVLYYSKNAEELQTEFVEDFLGCSVSMTAKEQKETFNSIIEETLQEDCDYEVVKTIHEKLNEYAETQKDSPEPPALEKEEVKRLLQSSGVQQEKLETFDSCFESSADHKAAFLASNIVSARKFEIKTPDVTIQVHPDRTDLVETRIIDGRQCLVITVNDHIEVNGIQVRTISRDTFSEGNDE
ncbi:MAG TPA: DUF4317 domain-containing protein [Candidatus Blautia avistercoris]|uniref:DUF4317 domain-containing protein n=1 Tax=Blautia sp. An249 TaxID=1965603 RepID=UPI000B3B031F|nr:DUF4317 domain-containing protein [Blautia sp. An249]OUO76455.1 hypothetical protein B5F53_17135 [Blautia sp. An249]HIY18337.1 DUF4317 domain-containing protein [Candidatus Blautia avistercoris]